MKLKMEFEASDVRDMLEQHFKRNGFEIRNLDEIVNSFTNAFPEGMEIQVDAIPPAELAPKKVKDEDALELHLNMNPEPPPLVQPYAEKPAAPRPKGKGNPKLSFSDMSDPTYMGIDKDTPVDEEVMQREIQHILKNSDTIEKSRT